MAFAMSARLIRPTVRNFSVHRPPPDTKASRIITMSCLVSAVVLPFVPPALESSRERNLGSPNHNKPHPPLCFHAR